MIPTWLARHLEAIGAANPDGYGRTVRAGICRRCGSSVLRGLDNDRAALPATVDPTPISAIGEVVAILAGAATYDITLGSRRAELHRRNRWHIPRRDNPVLADHHCGTTWPVDDQATPTATTRQETTTCPY